MITFGMIGGGSQAFDPLILLILALMLDAYLGDTPWLFKVIKHPVVIIGGLTDWLDQKLNREKRPEMDRAIRGAVAVLIVVTLSGTLGAGVAWLSLNHPFGWVVELLMLLFLLAGRSLYDHVKDVARGLRQNTEAGRDAVRHIVGRDPRYLDEHGVARAAIESASENYSDGLVAPVFWYVLFGAPGLFIYKAVNTMDSMIGHKTPRHRAFGMTAARLDDVLNLIPARLAGLFIATAALFVPTARPGRALKVMLRDAGKHRSPNAGWPEGAMAGALDLALAGPRRYAQDVAKDPWIGDGSARATAKDIDRCLYVYAVACLINAGWVAAIAVIRFSLPAAA